MMRTRANRRRSPDRPRRVPRVAVNWHLLLMLPATLLLVLAAIAAGGMLLDRPLEALIVEGTFQRVTPMQLEAALAPELDEGFLSVDLEALRRRAQALDWVDAVEVRRVWPDKLLLQVTEHRAAARWGEHGLLNVRGELFTEDARHAFPELPRLGGPPGSEARVAALYLEVRGRLAQAGLALDSLVMDERGAWQLVLQGGQELRLGRQEVGARVQRFFDVVAPALAGDLDRVAYVDLRYSNGFAIGWAAPPGPAYARAEGRFGSG